MQPIIGITTYGRDERDIPSLYYDKHFSLPVQYVDAVRRAGGIPVLLPPGEPHWRELLAWLDGVIVAGGVDVQPVHYAGNADHPAVQYSDAERDASELALARALAADGTRPGLFICRGMQVFNVALGGTLHEHIPDVRPEDIHRGADGGWTVQPVTVQPASALARMMQATAVATFSGHHQAVKRVAPGVTVVATAPDGIVEALEMGDHPWLIAVQWHPEVSAESDPTQQRIFDDLVRAATLRAATRRQP